MWYRNNVTATKRDVRRDWLWTEMYGNKRLARRTTWLSGAARRVEWLQLYVDHGLLLEVGCGTGEFLKVASDEGYDVLGLEASGWAVAEARKLGLEVEAGLLTDWVSRYPELRPDIVAL